MSTTSINRIVQPDKEELDLYLRRASTMYGSSRSRLALAVPTLEEVKAAIAAGVETGLEVRVVSGIHFKSVSSSKKKAVLKSTMKFETLTLTGIRDLEEESSGAFSFTGTIRHYDHEDFRQHGQFRTRGFSDDDYKVSYNPNLHIHSLCEYRGGGHGSQFEDEPVRYY